jgi:hypothetical protein
MCISFLAVPPTLAPTQPWGEVWGEISVSPSPVALGQAERVRDLDAAPPGEVAIEVELLLELEGLESRVRLTASFPLCNK